MDTEKSSNSSFEDLSNLNEADMKTASQMLIDNENNVKATKPIATMAMEVPSHSDGVSNNNNESPSNEEAKRTPVNSSIPKTDSNNGNKTPFDDNSDEAGSGDESAKSANESDPCDILGNGQLVKTVLIKSNTAKRPVRGELVTIDFTGKLEDGRIVEEQKDFKIHVGDFEVCQGLDMVIPLMNIDEVAEITVDARFAYGGLGLKNEEQPDRSIPPNAKIIYTVKLLDIKNEDFGDLKDFELRRKYGAQKKERANFWYNRNEYNTAIQLYRRALDYLDDRDGDPEAHFDDEDLKLTNSELQTLLNNRLVVYNNLAMAQIKISAYDAALKSVDHVLRCQPTNAKALYRKGRILEGKGDIKGAISLLQKAATLEPDTKAIQTDLSKLFIRQRREEHNEKELYQKMLGQAKKMEQKNKQKQQHHETQGSKLKLVGYLMGTILVGVAGVAIYRYKY